MAARSWRSKARWVALSAIVTGAMFVVPDVGQASAGAETAAVGIGISGLEKRTGTSAINSEPFKQAIAHCPEDKVVLGGGAWLYESGPTTRRLTLRVLRPTQHFIVGQTEPHDVYIAEAAEIAPGVSGNWWVQAYALCAYEPPGYQRVYSADRPFLTDPARRTNTAVCPSGTRALGSGAYITPADQEANFAEVGLQLSRASATGDITRAQASEDPNGYSGLWALTAVAVCANPPAGYEIVYGESDQRGSESEKYARASCTGDREVTGAGAGITNVAPGHVSLWGMFPSAPDSDDAWTQDKAVENVPYGQTWDFIVTQSICAELFSVD